MRKPGSILYQADQSLVFETAFKMTEEEPIKLIVGDHSDRSRFRLLYTEHWPLFNYVKFSKQVDCGLCRSPVPLWFCRRKITKIAKPLWYRQQHSLIVFIGW